MDQYCIRQIRKDDYDKHYLNLLEQLTTIEPDKITKDNFNSFIDTLNNNHSIFVIEHQETNTIIGSATLLVENKIIHNMGIVCHIEDVVIDSKFRGENLGKRLIDELIRISKELNCYKIILDCARHNVKFYEKCGFKENGIQMSLYVN